MRAIRFPTETHAALLRRTLRCDFDVGFTEISSLEQRPDLLFDLLRGFLTGLREEVLVPRGPKNVDSSRTMGATIVQFGVDSCYRLPIFRKAGYTVYSCDTADELELSFEQFRPGGIVFNENDEGLPLDALSVAHTYRSASLILFQGFSSAYGQEEFDLVIPAQTSPEEWLPLVAETIRRTQALFLEAREIRKASAELRDSSQQLRHGSALERERSRSMSKRIQKLFDKKTEDSER